MNPNELGAMWLREHAGTLRRLADKVERAYTGQLKDMCMRVAANYRTAAATLESGASELEAAPAHAGATDAADSGEHQRHEANKRHA